MRHEPLTNVCENFHYFSHRIKFHQGHTYRYQEGAKGTRHSMFSICPYGPVTFAPTVISKWSRVRLKPDGTRWRTGGEVKGKLAKGVGSQYSSHYLGTWVYPLMHSSQLPAVDWTHAPADLNGFVRFGERRNLVSTRVPPRFKRSLPQREESTCELQAGNYTHDVALASLTSCMTQFLTTSQQTLGLRSKVKQSFLQSYLTML
jgi:hypothetical protein